MDGMAVAERLRAHDPDAFTTLSQIPILYRFEERQWNSLPSAPCSKSIPRGSSAPSATTIARSRRFPSKGRASKSITQRIVSLPSCSREPARSVVRRLQPGDLVLFDNTRILHGHAAFSIGARHFQGYYLDADGLYSALAVLSRKRSLRGDGISA